MAVPPEHSDVSGQILDADAPEHVMYSFSDGRRRQVLMSSAEAVALRSVGEDVTQPFRRFLMHIPAQAIAKWFIAAGLAAGIGAWVSDLYSDKQAEIAMEGELISTISHDSVELFQDAQIAQRSATPEERSTLGNTAADTWSLSSAEIEGTLRAYYPDSAVLARWYAFQSALHRWGSLAIDALPNEKPDEASARRVTDLESIRAFAEGLGNPSRKSPVADPWAELSSDPPVDSKTYQWLGYYLLRGRGALLSQLREANPQLD